MLQIVEGRKPVIAKVHGAAFAAGCQLVASCDLAYSTKDALFATFNTSLFSLAFEKLSFINPISFA